MSVADQNAIIAVLRRDRPASAPDWTIAALAPAAGLKKQACRDAVQALRYQGKMEWASFALTPSMMIADAAGAAPPDPAARGWIDPADADRLRSEVRDYLERTGMALNTFSNRATNSTQIAAFMRGEGRVGINPARNARDFMARYPDGVAARKGVSHQRGFAVDDAQAAVARSAREAIDTEAADIAARADAVTRSRELQRQAALEAEKAGANRFAARRQGTRGLSTLTGGPNHRQSVEAVQSALAETPADAARALQRRWPAVWQAVLITARAQETTPMAMMIDAIETGLAAIEHLAGNQEEAA